MSTDDRAVGAPERLHPLFLLTGIGGALRGMAGGYALIAYLAVSGRLGTALIGAVLLLALAAVGLVLYWHRFEYRIGADEIRIDSGIVSRTLRSIPFDRVQDVEISQGPVARLLGLAKVKFETGASAGGREEEGVLQAITLERAQDIRSLVRARRTTAVEQAQEAEDERPPVFAMDLRRVLLAGLFNFSLAVFAGLIGLTQTYGDAAGFDPLSRDFWEPLLSRGNPLTDFLLDHQLAAAVAGIAVLLLVGVLTGVTRTLLREYGFRLDRTDVGLRRRRGLLTRSDVTVPAARAQAAIVASGPVRDSLGWRELRLQSLARDEGGKGDHVLAPLARDAEIGEILRQLGWRRIAADVRWKGVAAAYVWTLAITLAPLVLVALGNLLFEPLIGLVGLAVLAAALILRIVAWRRTRYALDRDRLLIRGGWWRRKLLILPLRRIQSVDLTQNFLSRWFGTASLRFGVAGGSGFSAHEIPALPEKSARELRRELLSQPA